MTRLRVGISPPPQGFVDQREATRFAAVAVDHGIDHLYTADHVAFRGGRGMDGLAMTAWLLGLEPRLGGFVGVYLLALRHPVPVARQIATIAELAPGRLVFGVGVGGEDRHEMEVCEVDPATRGRRTDEALAIVRHLLTGDRLDHRGEFFALDDARILPAPEPSVPIVIGGRSDAALARAGRLGDGWLATWCSVDRFRAGVTSIGETAAAHGRTEVAWQHGYQNWAGVGRDRADAVGRLGPAMEAFYRVPFEAFDRYTPSGSPGEIADFLAPYVEAGARTLNLTPIATDQAAGIAAVAEVKQRLNGDAG